MLAGQLEIQLLANIARLADDMNKAKGLVGGAMKNIEQSVATAKSVLGSLGIGLGVGYFASLIKGSIDAADRLHDLSITTGVAVEDLAGLTLAAKQSGGDLDSIAQSINKLSVNIGKDADKFKALGISAKEPLEAFKQLADIFVAIEDPQQRAAVMAEALGKSWAGAAPLLAEGGKKIGEMVGKGILLSGVTKDMTDKVDLFNDKMAEFDTVIGGVKNSLVTAMLPTLIELSKSLAESKTKTADLSDEFAFLADAASSASLVFRVAGLTIGSFFAQLKLNDFRQNADVLKQYKADVEAALAGTSRFRDALEKSRIESDKIKLTAPAVDPKASQEVKKLGEHFLSGDEAAKKAKKSTSEYAAALESLLKTIFPLDAAHKQFAIDVAILNGLLAKGVIDQEKYNVGFDKLIEKLPDVADETKKYIEAQKELKETYDSDIKALADADAAYEKEIKSIKDATEALKPYSRERTIAAKIVELMGTHTDKTAEKIRAMAVEYANAIEEFARTEKAIAAQEQIRDEMKRTADSIRDDLTDALLRGFESGKDFAQNFRDTLVNMFQTLVLRPTIQGILAPVSGVLAGLVPGSANAGAGGGFDLSNISSISNLVGSNLFGSGVGSLGANGLLTAAPVFEGGSLVAGAEYSSLFSPAGFAAAVPWLAIAAVALPFISGLFDDGPAERTAKFVTGTRGTNPRFSTGTPFGLTGISEDSFFSDQEMGQALDAFIAGISTTDKQIVEQLNLSTDQITAAKLNLEDLNNKTYNFGTEHEGIEGLTEITRDRYAAIFRAVNEDLSLLVATYDQADDKIGEYITGAVQLYKALDKVGDAMPELSKSLLAFASLSGQQLADTAAIINYASADPIKDAAELVRLQSRTLAQVWNEQGTELRKLIAEYDGSATATSQLAALTQSRYQIELQLAQQIMQVMDASHQMFASSADQIRFSVLSETEKYNSLRNKSLELEGILASATDPAKIGEIAKQLNDVTTQAFGLLTADQQRQQSEPFAKYLEGLDALVQQKLQDVQTTLSGEHDTSLPASIASAIETAMEKAAEKFLAAAQAQENAASKQQSAAAAQQAAANTPIRVDARVTLAGSEVGR